MTARRYTVGARIRCRAAYQRADSVWHCAGESAKERLPPGSVRVCQREDTGVILGS
jgi:hypothetical protein